jgi:hypothetical protein
MGRYILRPSQRVSEAERGEEYRNRGYTGASTSVDTTGGSVKGAESRLLGGYILGPEGAWLRQLRLSSQYAPSAVSKLWCERHTVGQTPYVDCRERWGVL